MYLIADTRGARQTLRWWNSCVETKKRREFDSTLSGGQIVYMPNKYR